MCPFIAVRDHKELQPGLVWPCGSRSGDLAVQFAAASRAARTAVEVTSEREAAIRDVATGVAAPVLVSFALWIRVKAVRTPAAAVLSRDGQVIYELMRRPAPLPDADLDLEYVYSSRLT
jgi:hypothetical protein